ncbi:MAG: VOC family protein [Candidatus Heimdallarchaeota archaeon]|nr:VOC family protein [Candidatus Heimdallarchaeota archaeon]
MKNHGFVHIELPTKDLDKAKYFYETVFEWEVIIQTGFDDYAFFKETEDGSGGAFLKSDKVLNGETTLYINTDNIDLTLEKIKEAKGEIVQKKTQISEEHGFYALFKDISGNLMGLWSKN